MLVLTTPIIAGIFSCSTLSAFKNLNYATKVMLGKNKVTDFTFNPQLNGYAIKQPVFSFGKFHGVNKKLGPEMKSTGESILFIEDLKDDQFYELYSRGKMYLSR